MPKITVTEEERAEILRMREVRALQAVAWNEAIDMCIEGLRMVWDGDADDRLARDTFIDGLQARKRNPSRP